MRASTIVFLCLVINCWGQQGRAQTNSLSQAPEHFVPTGPMLFHVLSGENHQKEKIEKAI